MAMTEEQMQVLRILLRDLRDPSDSLRAAILPEEEAALRAALSEIDDLRARLNAGAHSATDADKRDAERYRWLRDGRHNGFLLGGGVSDIGNFQVTQKREIGMAEYLFGERLDEALDRAMEGER